MAKLSAILAAIVGGLLWLLRGAWKKTAKTEAENDSLQADSKAAKAAKDKLRDMQDEDRDSVIRRLTRR